MSARTEKLSARARKAIRSKKIRAIGDHRYFQSLFAELSEFDSDTDLRLERAQSFRLLYFIVAGAFILFFVLTAGNFPGCQARHGATAAYSFLALTGVLAAAALFVGITKVINARREREPTDCEPGRDSTLPDDPHPGKRRARQKARTRSPDSASAEARSRSLRQGTPPRTTR